MPSCDQDGREAAKISIRPELPSDTQAIAKVIEDAFAGHPTSNNNEALIVARLREEGGLTISLVAEYAGNVVGHVAFSPVRISGNYRQWYGLGPVAVYKNWQREGVGSRLIETGLTALRQQGAKGCVVMGDPLYYKKFGFVSADRLHFNGHPSQYLMALAFDSALSAGELCFQPAFDVCS